MATLSNFVITSPTNQDILIYSNGNWINSQISGFFGILDGRYSINTHNHDGTYLKIGDSYTKAETYPASSLYTRAQVYTKAEVDSLLSGAGGGGGGTVDGASNIGTGANVFSALSAGILQFRRLNTADSSLLDIAVSGNSVIFTPYTPTWSRLVTDNGQLTTSSVNFADQLLNTTSSPIFVGATFRSSGDNTNNISISFSDSSALVGRDFTANTRKKYINLSNSGGSSDPGFIMHETGLATADSNKGVIHICPSDDNSGTDYISIHGTNDPETLLLRTDGVIETPSGAMGLIANGGSNAVNVTATGININNNAVYHEGHKPTWSEVAGKPSSFTPSAHSHSDLEVYDVRTMSGSNGSTSYHPTPDEMPGRAVSTYFSYVANTENYWRSALTVKGWGTNYAVWQLIGDSNTSTTDMLYLRTGVGANWGTPYALYHEGHKPAFSEITGTIGESQVSPTDFLRGDQHGGSSGSFSTTGALISGKGSGGVALTINDGLGNANVTFNHAFGKPEQAGNAARIEVNTDGTTNAGFSFELGSGVASGVSTALTQVVWLSETQFQYKGNKVYHAANDGSGSGLDADLLDGVEGAGYLRSNTTDSYSGGILQINTNSTSVGTGGQTNTLEIVQGGGSGDAFMSFHISGKFAGHLGLDYDTNDVFWGGWSNGTVKHRIYHENNVEGRIAVYKHLTASATVNDTNLAAGIYDFAPTIAAGVGLSSDWHNMINLAHNNANGYGSQLATTYGQTPRLHLRSSSGTTWGSWAEVYHTQNKQDHVPSLGAVNTMPTGRSVLNTGIHHYGTDNTTTNPPYSSDYGESIVWGEGLGGSIEIWGGWTAGGWGKLFTRALRNTQDNWSDWYEIYTDRTPVAIMNASQGYWGLPAGTGGGSSGWIRTPTSGLLPYASGGGSSSLGTSSWPFTNVYATNLNSSTITLSGIANFNNRVKISASGTIGGVTFDNGWLQVGTNTNGWSIDPNEIYCSGAGIIGTLSGKLTLNPASGEVDLPVSARLGGTLVMSEANSGNILRLANTNGYVEVGANNSSYAHFYTDRAQFYMNKGLHATDYFQVYNKHSRLTDTYLAVGASSAYYAELNNDGSLTKRNTAWTNNDAERTFLMHGWQSVVGDYIQLHATGNTGSNGAIVVGRDVFAVGKSNYLEPAAANDGDVLNTDTWMSVNADRIYLQGNSAIRFYDNWLRINDTGGFGNGIYCGNSRLRTDGPLEVGNAGANFFADSNIVKVNPLLEANNDLKFTSINKGILFNASGYNDGGGIRYTGTTGNDGAMEFWTSDDYSEPFVWRSYDIGLDGTGAYREWMMLNNNGVHVYDDSGDMLAQIGHSTGYSTIVNPNANEHPALIVQKSADVANAGAALLVACDGESTDILMEGRANAVAGSTDISGRFSNSTSGDMKFQIWANGNANFAGIVDTADTKARSDIRVKKDLKVIDNARTKVASLTGWTFLQTQVNERMASIIAQDLQKVLPEAVGQSGDGMLTVSPMGCIGLLVNALNEEVEENKQLKEKVSSLEERLERLERLING